LQFRKDKFVVDVDLESTRGHQVRVDHIPYQPSAHSEHEFRFPDFQVPGRIRRTQFRKYGVAKYHHDDRSVLCVGHNLCKHGFVSWEYDFQNFFLQGMGYSSPKM
jgi:hypothetical protein